MESSDSALDADKLVVEAAEKQKRYTEFSSSLREEFKVKEEMECLLAGESGKPEITRSESAQVRRLNIQIFRTSLFMMEFACRILKHRDRTVELLEPFDVPVME
jgi:hypothetical protein